MLKLNEIVTVSDSFIHLEEFVDRMVETNQFQTLVDKRYDERDAHKRIIAFYGPPGIGKTMLLDRLEFECVRMKVPYSRINFEAGTYNNTIEILRELVHELDPQAFRNWTQLDQYWFSCEMDIPELNVNVRGQQAGLIMSADNVNISGDVVAGSKVEIRNNTINMSTRAALDPLGAQTALTESFIKTLGEFVQERPAVILFEGLDHEYCSQKTRVWVDGLLDRIRVLKGYGVLPVVTYFNAPNYEAKLRSVTMRAELKPLTQEHIAEYFRARRMPERMVMDAAKACLDETQGIPARVYEYTETNFPVFEEEVEETSVESLVGQAQEIQESPQAEQTPLVEHITEAPESAEPVLESIPSVPAETILEAVVAVEQMPAEHLESSVTEVTIVESPAVVLPEEATQPLGEDAQVESDVEPSVMGSSAEFLIEQAESSELSAAQIIQETKTDAVDLSQEATASDLPTTPQADIQEIPEPTSLAAVETEMQATQETPTAEPPVELEPQAVAQPETEPENQEAPQPVPQPAEELKIQPTASPVSEVSAAAETVVPTQARPEETKQNEDAFLRNQERAKQLKSAGKSSTGIMIESVLERHSDNVADMARRCAVLRWFTADLIVAIADEPLSAGQAEEILATISSWRFVQNFGYGTAGYRREIQQYLRAELHKENPALYAEIHKRALAYFEKRIGSIDINDEMIWVNLQGDQVTALREYLYYLLHVDVARGFSLLGKLFQSAQRLYMHGEAAILLKFADEIDKATLSENYVNLLSYYEAALEFAEGDAASAEAKLRALMAKTLDNELNAQVQGQLGVICAAGGKFDEAIKFFEQAQKFWQNLKRERERAKLSNNLGNVYMRKNDPGRAERSFSDALSGLNKAGTPSERALTLNNLGNAYMQKENLSKALEHYQKSLDIKKSIGDQFGAANTHSNLGTVYQRMAQEASGKKQVEYRQQAAEYYTRSLEAYRTFGARSNQGKLLFKLAYFYYQAGDKPKAREYLPDALEIFRDLEMPDLENASKLEKQLG